MPNERSRGISVGQAEECRAKAAKATGDVVRAEWIMMAHGWEILAREIDRDEKPG